MANPTATQLKAIYSQMVDDVLGATHTGNCTDEEMANVITGGVTVFETVDPTKKPTIKHIGFE